MKIKETAKGNVQITMSKGEANSFHELLDRLSLEDYEELVERPDDIISLWSLFKNNNHIL